MQSIYNKYTSQGKWSNHFNYSAHLYVLRGKWSHSLDLKVGCTCSLLGPLLGLPFPLLLAAYGLLLCYFRASFQRPPCIVPCVLCTSVASVVSPSTTAC